MPISDPAIITLFQNAPSSSRHELLKALSSHFHPSDWNYLHGLLCNRSYYIDFLALLPLEISLQVIKYLPREQIILLRRVSRCWHSLLTSPEICRALAHYFFPHLATTHLDPAIHFDNILSRRLSFMRVNPSYTEGKLYIKGPTSLHADTSTFAFVTHRNQIQVRHLSDPLALKLPPKHMNDWSQISRITLSASLVAAISEMGFCQVWDLATHASHSFKIPSSRVFALHSDGNTIGIGFTDEFIIHNAATNKTRNFAASETYWIRSVIVHEANNRIWTVEIAKAISHIARITSRNLETGETRDIIDVPRGFLIGGDAHAKYAGNGVWYTGSSDIKISCMSIEVWQILIDVTHTQTVSFKSYSVTLPPWESNFPELSSLSLMGNVWTWGDISWAYIVNQYGEDDTRITWDHSTLQGRIGSDKSWQLIENYDYTGKVVCCSDSFMVAGYELWGGGWRDGVVMRFDGIHERSEAATALVTNAD